MNKKLKMSETATSAASLSVQVWLVEKFTEKKAMLFGYDAMHLLLLQKDKINYY